MPSSIIAIGAAELVGAWASEAIAFGLLDAGIALGSEVAIGNFIGGGIGLIAGSAAGQTAAGLLYGSPSAPSFTGQAQGRDQVVRSAVANRTVVYGRAMVSGPLVFAAVSGGGNAKLHMVVPLAGHEIDAVEAIYFNDVELGARDSSGNVTTGQYAGAAAVRVQLGAAGDPADAALVSSGVGWTTAHKLTGVAYLVVELNWNQDIFPAGIPNIKAKIRGKKVYDPRTATTAWSANAALCARDYLISSYGLECTSDELDDASFIAAANIADESIALAAGGTEARYACHGVVDTGQTPRAIMEGLLSSGAGFLVWTGGKYVLHAGAYTAPAVTLTADDLRDSIKVRPRIARRDLFNAVRGTFVDPAQYWQPTDFPPVSNATYAVQDGGQVIWRDVALPFTTSAATAQRIAKLMLERSRQGITVEFPAKLTAFKVATLDTVMLTISQLGWSAKEFKVLEWKFSADGGVDLLLQEETAASYSWNSGMETVIDPAPDTNLPDPGTVQAPGTPSVSEAPYETTGSAGVKTRVTVAFASVDAYAISQRLNWRAAGGAWATLPDQRDTTFVLDDVAPGVYEFRAATVNVFGVASAWSATTTKEVLGLAAVPAAVSGFTVIKSAGFALAEWALHPDLDVRIGGRIVVRHSPLTSGAQWEDGIIVQEFNGDAVSGSLPLMTGTYMAKAKDSSGNWSTTAVSFVATEGMVTGFSIAASSVQHAAFAGAKSNTAVLGGALRLAGLATISSMATPVSTWGKISSLGGIRSSGSYSFDAALDLTTVATRRFEADIQALSFNTGDTIGKRGLVSEWGSVTGAAVNDCDATLNISTTNDDPAGSPAWGPWTPFFVGDFTCRAARFRLDLASGQPTNNISVSALRVDAKVPA